MWTQDYLPVADSLTLSAFAASIPLVVLGLALGVWRVASWKASLLALLVGTGVALGIYGMPPALVAASALYGAAFGLFPIGWLVFPAILLFDIVVESGRFGALQRSLADISPDARIQALLIAFVFGAFLEGAAGAGTPVAISASLLTGLGFAPLMAGGLSLLANTAPVAFGALGLPVVTVAAVTGLPLQAVSSAAGRLCPPLALIVPAYLIIVMSGPRSARAIWPVLLVCGASFAAMQFVVANFIGPYLVDIVGAIATMAALVIFLRFWKPSRIYRMSEQPMVMAAGIGKLPSAAETPPATAGMSGRQLFNTWLPYLLLVAVVVITGAAPAQRILNRTTLRLDVPALHNAVQRTSPVVPVDAPYPAVYVFNWLSAAGTACLAAVLLTAAVSGITPRQLGRVAAGTGRRLALPILTISAVVALAYLMNYSGATATLGLAAAGTGVLLPFFGAFLGWLGTFLTGSATANNALFGPLQVVSAQKIGINPILIAAVTTVGAVTGKMISIQSIAVAAAATGMPPSDEGKLFRFTLKHSIILAGIVGLLASFYAYVVPGWMPSL